MTEPTFANSLLYGAHTDGLQLAVARATTDLVSFCDLGFTRLAYPTRWTEIDMRPISR
jgi:hypothetical protein